MRRAEKEARGRVIIRVRYYGGTYIATGGGQRTSCTAGPCNAAHRHASKLFRNNHFNLAALAEANFWRATLIPEAQT